MSQPIPHNGVGVLGLGSGRVPVAERPMPMFSEARQAERQAERQRRQDDDYERQYRMGKYKPKR